MKKGKNAKARVTTEVPLNSSYSYLLAPPALLSLFAFLFYRPSLHYNFQFDDLANITKLFSIRHITLNDLFFKGPRWISGWLNTVHYRIGKFDPFSYRLFNVITHSLTSILIFYLFYIALSGLKKKSFFSTNALKIAFTTAMVFLLHPVQTQTVSYVIQGQLEGLAAFFIISITLCFLFISQSKTTLAKACLTTLLLILAAFSCGTKEIAIMSPFLVALFDWFFIAQGDASSFKKRLVLHAVYFCTVFGIYLYFLKPQFFINLFGLKIEARNNIGNILTHNPTDKILPFPFFISQFKVILHYLFMFIWPFMISVEYDWKLVKGFFALDCFFPFIALCVVAYLVLRLLNKDKAHIGTFGLLWFFISIAPRSSFIPSSELLTDYKTYTGSIGIAFLLALGIVKLFMVLSDYIKNEKFNAHKQHINHAFLILLAFPIGWATYERNKVWRSGEEFWENIIQNAPGKARAYNNYAVALSEKGLYKESIPIYQKAIDMDGSYPDPLNNIAVAYSFIGDLDKAIAALKRSIMIQPMYPEAYNNLASFLISKKEYDQAEKALSYAIKLRPYYGKAFFNLGKVYLYKDNPEQAFECFKNACTKADLDNESGFQLYAHMSMRLKKYNDAVFAYTKMVELQPTKENIFNLAHAYFLNENFTQSTHIYQNLLQKFPQERNAWYNLGEVYLKIDKPEQALHAFNKAKELNHTIPNLPLRIAYCYKLLNKWPEMERLLKEVIAEPSMPEQFKIVARNELAQIKNASVA
jgi:protein O-mannosyl-transferase